MSTEGDEAFLQSFQTLCAVAGEKRYVTSIGNRFFKHYSADTASLKNLLQYLISDTDPSNKICARLGITSTNKKQELFEKMQAQVSHLEINRP